MLNPIASQSVDRRHFAKSAAVLAAGAMAWSSSMALARSRFIALAGFKARGDRLKEGKDLKLGDGLVSSKKRFCLKLEPDGNLVEYFYGTNVPVWSAGTAGGKNTSAVMQSDGNFVLYRDGKPVFATGTDGRETTGLVLQDDGNCVIYDKKGNAIWASGRYFSEKAFTPTKVEVSKETLAIMKANPDNPASSIILGNSAAAATGFEIGVVCSTTPAGVLICTIALILVAVAIEFTGDKPFGPGNDLRVIGGKVSDEWKQSGRDLKGFINNPGKTTKKEFERLKRRLGF